jgi:hypothetical protein
MRYPRGVLDLTRGRVKSVAKELHTFWVAMPGMDAY